MQPYGPVETTPAAARPAAAWVALGAGIAGIAGSFLPWVKITAPIIGTMTASGTDGSDGWITAVLGAAVVAFAAVRLSRPRVSALLSALAVMCAIALLGIGVWKIVDLKSSTSDFNSSMAGQNDPLGIGAALSSTVHINVGAGLWLIAAAGLVGALSAARAAASRRNQAVR